MNQVKEGVRALTLQVGLACSLLVSACTDTSAGRSQPESPIPETEVRGAEQALTPACPTGPAFPSCYGHCGFLDCSPTGQACCACDEGCQARGDCCCDYADACAPTAPPPPAGPSCAGYCGGAAPGGVCYCDTACASYGDCCDDYATVCGAPPSCEGHCGGAAPGGACYCDTLCAGYGDCCGDYEAVCAARQVVQISAGGRQTCALLDDGNVRCWGLGEYGVLGYGSTANVADPTSGSDVPLGGTAVQIATGYYHTCALLSGGSVKCWGRNEDGQLGYPGHGNVGDDETPASMPAVAVGGTVVQLAAGIYHTCARIEDGSLRCWGGGLFGALGYGNMLTIGDDETPASAGAVPVGGTVSEIRAGGFASCARMASGAIRCWGSNYGGTLGYGVIGGSYNQIGDDETPASMGNVPTGGAVLALDVEDTNICARFSGGGVKCWGSGSAYLGYGGSADLGDDEPVSAIPALAISGSVAEVGTGSSHHCLRMSTGHVRCWGYVVSGGLGYGSTSPITTPGAAGNIALGGSAAQLSVGYGHTCALLTSGGIRCWGAPGALGHAGAGAVGDDETPADVPEIVIP